jgi:hypothetical protein
METEAFSSRRDGAIVAWHEVPGSTRTRSASKLVRTGCRRDQGEHISVSGLSPVSNPIAQ